MPVQLRLLGRPRWGHEYLGADKTHLLLYYLAFRAEWSSREEIATLFWPEEEVSRGRRNLRQLLYRVKRVDGAAALEIGTHRLRLLVETDAQHFRDAIGAGRWSTALSHYGGPLLEGIRASDIPAYEAWLTAERADLHASRREAAVHVASELESSERHADAAALLGDMWRHDRFDESLLQGYLRNAYLSGERDQALKAYDAFEELLRDELGLRPMEDTAELIGAISAGAPMRPAAQRPQARVSLPAPSTPFVGRDVEREDIGRLLARADLRLVVIVGPGGVGKTRFAIEAAADQAGRFEHGVWFVPLADAGSAEAVIAAVAAALEFPLYGNRDPNAQLLDFLRDKEMLLVVDNLEHVIEGSAWFLELLAVAPRVRLLATSREEFRAEQHAMHYRLGGLPFGASADDVPASDAGRLFVHAARRASPRFAMRETDRSHLFELCALTDGLPLALELAAAWAWRMTVGEIVGEVREHLGILAPPGGEGAPEGLRAVYEHSWSLLNAEERSVLTALSVFRGGAPKDAANEVAGASLYVLLSLVGKSLLHKGDAGRYEMHPLIARWATEKLDEGAGAERIRRSHASYYAALSERMWSLMEEGREQAWLERMSVELPNLLAMWSWSVRHRDGDVVVRTAKHLTAFFSLRSRYREGVSLVALALEAFPDPTLVRGRLLARLGNLHLRQRGAGRARPLLEEATEILRHGEDALELAFAEMNLAAVARTQGNPARAEELFRTSLARVRELGHRKAVGHALFNLGLGAFERGDLTEARERYRECLAIADDIGDRFAGGYARVRLADTLLVSGDAGEARRLYLAGMEEFQALDHPMGLAHGKVGLARLALHEGAPERAGELLGDAHAVYRETGSRIEAAEAMALLGDAAAALGDRATARERYLRALEDARNSASMPGTFLALLGLLRVGDARSDAALACAIHLARHPAVPAGTRSALDEHVTELGSRMSADDRRAAEERALGLALDDVVVRLSGGRTT